jgi:hypothetical protein
VLDLKIHCMCVCVCVCKEEHGVVEGIKEGIYLSNLVSEF